MIIHHASLNARGQSALTAGRLGRALSLKSSKSVLKKCAALSSNTASANIPPWATIDPAALGRSTEAYKVPNLVGGDWRPADRPGEVLMIPDPMDRNNFPIFTVPDTQVDGLGPFVESMARVPKTGMHNPLKNVERYLQYGEITRRAGAELMKPEVAEFFANSITRCVPKSKVQALGEVRVTAQFLNNFGGDNVRFLARDFGVPGDHVGQKSVGYRWPYGAVCIIAPFNFPLEIPVLQLMGALFMGNKPVLKPAEKVSIVMEQFLRLLHHVGMPVDDVDLLNCQGPVAGELLQLAPIRLTQFTGSSRVGELLSEQTRGKVKIEDAGFDWKILGPDVSDLDYVAWQCDQDAYSAQGQKCSAQSILFAHRNWTEAGLLEKIKANASTRSLADLTIGPVLTHTTDSILEHKDRLLRIPGAKVLFGGRGIMDTDVPDEYGVLEPTAVFVPLDEMLKDEHFDACVTEMFAPFQVVTEFNDGNVDKVITACERMSHHLSAAVVSNDIKFQHRILSNTVNGTTYVGMRARTTGAPQNHWFGPAGDPRGAGIGTPEAIKLVWSCHREIIHDTLVPDDWQQSKAS